MDLETCPECQKPVLDHAFAEALKCAHARALVARVLMRHALSSAEETVDGGTWTRAGDVRGALESQDQVLMYLEEAWPVLKGDDGE